jgi:large subunit ribosomal protein L7/L12
MCNARPSSFVRPSIGATQQRIQRRWASEAAAAPANPKIATIVDQISQLTLLETADLVSTLKVRTGRNLARGGSYKWRLSYEM